MILQLAELLAPDDEDVGEMVDVAVAGVVVELLFTPVPLGDVDLGDGLVTMTGENSELT